MAKLIYKLHNLYLELILAVLYLYPEFSGWTVRDSGKSSLVVSPPFPSLQSQAEPFQWESLKSDFCWSSIFKYLPNDSLPCQRFGIFPEGNLYSWENAKYHCLDCYLDTKKMKISHWMEITTPQRVPHARLLEIGLSSLCSSVPRTADLVAVLLSLDTIFTTFKNYVWITSFCRKF